jgi:hypothetical protein
MIYLLGQAEFLQSRTWEPDAIPEGYEHMATASASKKIETTKTVFDLDAKGEVTLKKIGETVPVTSMDEFVSRMHNDAAAILKFANIALEKYEAETLADNPAVAWQVVEEGENGEETLAPFTGTILDDKKQASLNATVIQMAKMLFGYAKQMVSPKDGATDAEKDAAVAENRAAKAAAKASALALILSNPAAVEGLKKA